jgi:hypothetical protein|tara:strand:- start:2779 stop:3069 length:291 start_codon:yes stop_codon:yes gene_type:complete
MAWQLQLKLSVLMSSVYLVMIGFLLLDQTLQMNAAIEFFNTSFLSPRESPLQFGFVQGKDGNRSIARATACAIDCNAPAAVNKAHRLNLFPRDANP